MDEWPAKPKPGAIKDVGTGMATATGAVKAWNALQEWKRERR